MRAEGAARRDSSWRSGSSLKLCFWAEQLLWYLVVF